MPWQNKKTKYEVLEHLGSGSFGEVTKVKRCSDGEVGAILNLSSTLSHYLARFTRSSP